MRIDNITDKLLVRFKQLNLIQVKNNKVSLLS